MKGNKNNGSIFDNCHVSASQESFLRSCGFAQRGVLPDSDPDPTVGISPTLNDGEIESRRVSDDPETDSVIDSRYEEDLVESHPIRLVSPPESADTVDLKEVSTDRTVPVDSKDSADRTVHVESKDSSDRTVPVECKDSEDRTVPVESKDSADRTVRVECKVDEDGGGKKKRLKVPMRDVVKAIVMNSRNIGDEEEDKETEKRSFVQILVDKGFKF